MIIKTYDDDPVPIAVKLLPPIVLWLQITIIDHVVQVWIIRVEDHHMSMRYCRPLTIGLPSNWIITSLFY